MWRTVAGLALISLASACNGSSGGGSGVSTPGLPGLATTVVASGLSSPLHLTAPASDPRLFIIEKPGRIRIVENGQLHSTPFLDISNLVSTGGEQGLLSLAFHPQYAANGYFYVNYTDSGGHTRVVRYTVSADPNVADAASAKTILGVTQPASNHNGGHILFGPDGMLYIAMGDGGGGGDTFGNGQDTATLHGALLRIDVDHGDPYAIPTDNPLASQPGARAEIWAYGLRNPWRIAFDRATNLLYIADVGQNAWEEVNVAAAATGGLNYGWNIMEGQHCFNGGNCNSNGLVLPVLEYDHGVGCSITGGHVYRGSAIPAVRGHYFYSDFCSGFLRSFVYANGGATDAREWELGSLGRVLSFGEDGVGELYVLSQNGNVYRLIAN